MSLRQEPKNRRLKQEPVIGTCNQEETKKGNTT